MRHRRFGSLAVVPLLVACASADGRAPSATAPAAILEEVRPLPVAALPRSGERLEFGVALAGLPIGNASLVTQLDGDAWRVEVTGGTNRLIDWIYAVRGKASARIDPGGQSRSFYLWIDEDGDESERSLKYDGTPCLYYRTRDQESWVATLTQYVEPRDPLSLLQELRTLAPSAEPRDFEVAMTLRSFCYRVHFLGREEVAVGAGTFADALLWRIEVRPYLELGATRDVGPIVGFYEVAISADEHRLPLRIVREFGFGQVALELRQTMTEPHAVVALQQ